MFGIGNRWICRFQQSRTFVGKRKSFSRIQKTRARVHYGLQICARTFNRRQFVSLLLFMFYVGRNSSNAARSNDPRNDCDGPIYGRFTVRYRLVEHIYGDRGRIFIDRCNYPDHVHFVQCRVYVQFNFVLSLFEGKTTSADGEKPTEVFGSTVRTVQFPAGESTMADAPSCQLSILISISILKSILILILILKSIFISISISILKNFVYYSLFIYYFLINTGCQTGLVR